ncbi:Na+/H+ antiporter NhaC family protein [Mogibacterium timidum]|uniref:Na+/H+ antiporter NhaC family protein n=2 Tax=Mogibacterium timidum TaxID=35519 RepID=UPI0028D0C925|nr:Na+/H+ antiporter NhaC family protein [Mogibacterium timidum]
MIRINRNRILYVFGLAALFITAMPIIAMAADSKPALYATGWAVLPPIVAIGLALITKEVYSSLFIGILAGGLLYSGMDFSKFMNHVMIDGFVTSLSTPGNVGILVFLVILGMLVSMMNLSGGSAAFGSWAAQKIRTRRGAEYSTVALGLMIFVDDYFNCLTVGSVMKPLTDKYNVSRAKLAYLIDATAAPVCILAPISSWAAAVSGFVQGKNGLSVFIQAIPYNFYALLTIAMMFMIITMNFDYGKMAVYEKNAAEEGDLFTVKDAAALKNDDADDTVHQGTVMDLVFPVIVLIISCVIGMLYTGGFWKGKAFVDAFAGCDAATSLVLGSTVALVITVVYYLIRRVVPFAELMECIPEGFKSMVSPILVLSMAWTLKGMTDSLGLARFVANMMDKVPGGFVVIIPALFFVVSCALGFASGTSWGTFGILIPIALAVTSNRPDMMIVLISACMAGGVCGDHCSPISDTTIMSSAGAAVRHLSHVETQLPYAVTVLCLSTVSYIIAGIMESPWVALAVGLVLLYIVLRFFKKREGSYVVDEAKAIETATSQTN